MFIVYRKEWYIVVFLIKMGRDYLGILLPFPLVPRVGLLGFPSWCRF